MLALVIAGIWTLGTLTVARRIFRAEISPGYDPDWADIVLVGCLSLLTAAMVWPAFLGWWGWWAFLTIVGKRNITPKDAALLIGGESREAKLKRREARIAELERKLGL